jgi:5-methylcytosine-specific restriction enzyme A
MNGENRACLLERLAGPFVLTWLRLMPGLKNKTKMLNFKTKKDQYKRMLIFKKDSFKCNICDYGITNPPTNYTGSTTLIEGGRWLEIDHIKALSKGGNDDLENLQTLCNVCNCRKGAK